VLALGALAEYGSGGMVARPAAQAVQAGGLQIDQQLGGGTRGQAGFGGGGGLQRGGAGGGGEDGDGRYQPAQPGWTVCTHATIVPDVT